MGRWYVAALGSNSTVFVNHSLREKPFWQFRKIIHIQLKRITSYRFVMMSSQMFIGSILASGYLFVQVFISLLRGTWDNKLPKNNIKGWRISTTQDKTNLQSSAAISKWKFNSNFLSKLKNCVCCTKLPY